MADNRHIEIEHRLSEDINRLDTKIHNIEMAMHTNQPAMQMPDSGLEKRVADLEHLISSIEIKLINSGIHPHLDENTGENKNTQQAGYDTNSSFLSENSQNKIAAIETNLKNMLSRINSLEIQGIDSSRQPDSAAVLETACIGDKINSIKTKNRTIDIIQLEETINNYMRSMDHRLGMKIIEIEEKLDNAFRGIPSKDHYEKHIEDRVINMLSDKIERFARLLDKKLLEYPSRPEIEKRLVRLEGMIAMIEHPNLRPMEQRLGELELKISDLTRFMHHYAERVPLVVE